MHQKNRAKINDWPRCISCFCYPSCNTVFRLISENILLEKKLVHATSILNILKNEAGLIHLLWQKKKKCKSVQNPDSNSVSKRRCLKNVQFSIGVIATNVSIVQLAKAESATRKRKSNKSKWKKMWYLNKLEWFIINLACTCRWIFQGRCTSCCKLFHSFFCLTMRIFQIYWRNSFLHKKTCNFYRRQWGPSKLWMYG